jgi:hypothetical protein
MITNQKINIPTYYPRVSWVSVLIVTYFILLQLKLKENKFILERRPDILKVTFWRIPVLSIKEKTFSLKEMRSTHSQEKLSKGKASLFFNNR